MHVGVITNGEENQSTIEHIGKFTLQCREVRNNDVLKLRLFLHSLSKTTFTWFINLLAISIHTWVEMENQFYAHFYRVECEGTFVALFEIKQRVSKNVEQFINKFKRAKNRCRMYMPKVEFESMAQNGLEFE